MAVSVITIYDGQTYYPGDSLPDLGNWVCVSVKKNSDNEFVIRKYEGLSVDVSKLPHYDNLSTGSSALCIDTGDFYKYEKSTDTWYKMPVNSGSSGGGTYIDPIGEGYDYLVTEETE